MLWRITGLGRKSPVSSTARMSNCREELRPHPRFRTFEEGMQTKPDLVVIATYTETHADYAIRAMEQGAHVFVEKPLAANVADAERVVATAKKLGRKLVVGYILRHHPSWVRLIAEARGWAGLMSSA